MNFQLHESHDQLNHHFRTLLVRQTGRHDLLHADLSVVTFQSLDMDELDAVEFACAIELEFGITVEDEIVTMVAEDMSIEAIIHAIDTLLRCRPSDTADT